MAPIHIKVGDNWHSVTAVSSRGYAFMDGKLLAGEALAQYLSYMSVSDTKLSLNKLNGFFALIKKINDSIMIAVDHMRSYPLFYSVSLGNLFISDDAHWILDQIDDKTLDNLAEQEFILTGYVTGPSTLYTQIKQVQSGEFIIFQITSEGINVSSERYFQYRHHDYFPELGQQLQENYLTVLHNVFNRLISFANGRAIVVPLSGGYDSRLIALMLKNLGYENLVAFSYGIPGNMESNLSQSVAQSLGIKWLFVPYSHQSWHKWYHSEERENYCRLADGLSSLPVVQDWPAVRELKLGKKIPEDSVFVPGHSGGLLAGEFARYAPRIYKTKKIDLDVLIEEILQGNFMLWDWSDKRLQLYPLLKKRILATLGSIEKFPDAASAFESWNCHERQAKYIVNSVRTYEYWGYDWSLPEWDREFIDFWLSVPLEKRIGKILYDETVKSLQVKIAPGKIFPDLPSTKNAMKYGIKYLLRKTPLYRFIKKAILLNSINSLYDKHIFASYGMIDKEVLKKLCSRSDSITGSIVAFRVLEMMGKVKLTNKR